MWRRQAPGELILRVFLSGTSQATEGGQRGGMRDGALKAGSLEVGWGGVSKRDLKVGS